MDTMSNSGFLACTPIRILAISSFQTSESAVQIAQTIYKKPNSVPNNLPLKVAQYANTQTYVRFYIYDITMDKHLYQHVGL